MDTLESIGPFLFRESPILTQSIQADNVLNLLVIKLLILKQFKNLFLFAVITVILLSKGLLLFEFLLVFHDVFVLVINVDVVVTGLVKCCLV